MEILVLVILYLVVSVERLVYLQQERALKTDMYPICFSAGNVYTVGRKSSIIDDFKE